MGRNEIQRELPHPKVPHDLGSGQMVEKKRKTAQAGVSVEHLSSRVK